MPATNAGQPAKKLVSVQHNAAHHWVGDGFPVRTLLTYSELGARISPFLLLDHVGPMEFSPTQQRLGVGEHPHRGFETVTIVYAGEVEHRDSGIRGGARRIAWAQFRAAWWHTGDGIPDSHGWMKWVFT